MSSSLWLLPSLQQFLPMKFHCLCTYLCHSIYHSVYHNHTEICLDSFIIIWLCGISLWLLALLHNNCHYYSLVNELIVSIKVLPSPRLCQRTLSLVIVCTALLGALKSFLKVPTCFYHHFFFKIKCSPSKAWIIGFPYLQGTLDYILSPLLL